MPADRSFCRYSFKISGVFGHRFGPKISSTPISLISVEIFLLTHSGVLPREIRVRLGESQLRQLIHHLWPRKRLRQKRLSRDAHFSLRDRPLPEREGLCVRIIHAKNANALRHPIIETHFSTPPTAPWRLALKIEGINILIFLGQILRVAPCRPAASRTILDALLHTDGPANTERQCPAQSRSPTRAAFASVFNSSSVPSCG